MPLTAGGGVQLIHVDGTSEPLQCAGGGVTVTLSEDPVLLLYDGEDATLAGELRKPSLSLVGQPPAIEPGEKATLAFQGDGADEGSVRVLSPPRWKTAIRQTGEGRIEVEVQAPETTAAREARIRVQLLAGGEVAGELTAPVSVARSASPDLN